MSNNIKLANHVEKKTTKQLNKPKQPNEKSNPT
jgi:hypothetical protein